MQAFARCFCFTKSDRKPRWEKTIPLSSKTPFNVNEVETLYDLFKKLSKTDSGKIHKEEFQVALFRNNNRRNFFAERVFDLFDIKRNGYIEFEDFVSTMSIFHPNALEADKIEFAFKLYDVRNTGFIEHEELKVMVLALLSESDLTLTDDIVTAIVDKTFMEVDSKGDGKIDVEEWKQYVANKPSLIKNMTLPYLKELTIVFPSFLMNTEVQDSEMSS